MSAQPDPLYTGPERRASPRRSFLHDVLGPDLGFAVETVASIDADSYDAILARLDQLERVRAVPSPDDEGAWRTSLGHTRNLCLLRRLVAAANALREAQHALLADYDPRHGPRFTR